MQFSLKVGNYPPDLQVEDQYPIPPGSDTYEFHVCYYQTLQKDALTVVTAICHVNPSSWLPLDFPFPSLPYLSILSEHTKLFISFLWPSSRPPYFSRTFLSTIHLQSIHRSTPSHVYVPFHYSFLITKLTGSSSNISPRSKHSKLGTFLPFFQSKPTRPSASFNYVQLYSMLHSLQKLLQVLSSNWDGRPFDHNRHGWKEWGLLYPFWGELGPHLIQCGLGRGLPPYQVASWSIQPFGHNRHGPKIGGYAPWGELGLHLTQCGWGQVSSWSIQTFGHDTPTLQTDRQDQLDNGPIA